MKAMKCCVDCLKGLAEKTVRLSGGNERVLSACYSIVEELRDKGYSPPGTANRILKYIKHATGVYDPYALLKEKELVEAKKVSDSSRRTYVSSLEGLLKLSALGNSTDFFTTPENGFDVEGMFSGNVDKIEEEIYTKNKDILILGDNIGDFIFDLPLVHFLESRGKRVYYGVKSHPVQNDLSMADAMRFGFTELFDNIISTGIDEVGIRREGMKGKIKEMWDTDAVVIAKGMGNYETLSENHGERPVIHILKVKCPAVSEAVHYPIGTYMAKLY